MKYSQTSAPQTGFAVLEAILVIVILAIIGGTGYYIWHTKQATDKALETVTTTTKAEEKQSTPTKTEPSSTYFTIKEWGVRAAYSGSDIYHYTFEDPENPNLVAVSSAALAAKYGGDCSSFGAGEIVRATADQAIIDDGTTGPQLEARGTEGLSHVGSYYYLFRHDQAACSDTVTVAAQNAANTQVKAFVGNFKSAQ